MTAQAESVRKLKDAADNVDELSKVKLARLFNLAARMVQEHQTRIADGAVHHDLSAEFRHEALFIDSLTAVHAAEKLQRAAEILDLLISPKDRL